MCPHLVAKECLKVSQNVCELSVFDPTLPSRPFRIWSTPAWPMLGRKFEQRGVEHLQRTDFGGKISVPCQHCLRIDFSHLCPCKLSDYIAAFALASNFVGFLYVFRDYCKMKIVVILLL